MPDQSNRHDATETDDFTELYRAYVTPVFRYCHHRLDSKEQAEDATSQVFLKALGAYSNRIKPESVRGWLFTIAHNVVVDLYRARKQVWPLEAVENGLNEPSVDDDSAAVVERDEVREMLQILPDDQRRVLELRLAGLTSAEIAVVLGKKQGAVKMAQSRAIARLRAHALDPQALGEDRDAGG